MLLSLKASLVSAGLFAGLALPCQSFATTIDFSTLTAANGSPFTTYTEGGFTVSAPAGTFYVTQAFGNSVPAIFNPSGTGTATVVGTAGSGLFTFSSVDLADAVPGYESYVITGQLNGSTVFTTGGGMSQAFTTYGTGFSAYTLTSLSIAFAGGKNPNIDNIVVNAVPAAVTPEPNSIVLLGTGLIGLSSVVRRRVLASR